jgi:hypothetical protein
MDDYPTGTQEAVSLTGTPQSKALRHEVAEFLRANKDRMVAEIDRVVESAVPGYESLSPDLLADVRQSFRDFFQLYMDYFEADELPRKFIKSEPGHEARDGH